MNFIQPLLYSNKIKDNKDKYQELLDSLETGDIILFNGQGFWFSYLVEWFTESSWSHVGVVLRDPVFNNKELKGLYLWESAEEVFQDAEDNCKKWGVQIQDLDRIIKNYQGKVVIRKLRNIDNPNFRTKDNVKYIQEALIKIHEIVHNKPYDANPVDLILGGLGITLEDVNNKKINEFFCSALVSYIYCELGIFGKDFNWDTIMPKHFDEKYSPTMISDKPIIGKHRETLVINNTEDVVKRGVYLPFIDGYTLGPEILIK